MVTVLTALALLVLLIVLGEHGFILFTGLFRRWPH
jgi:hypothetical protein